MIPTTGQNRPQVLIGTYTEPEESQSEGIYVYRMDSSTGELSYETVIKDVPNVSYMAVHPQSGLIFAVNETEEFDGHPGGGVSVLARDRNGNFTVRDRQSSAGSSPAYISIEQTGRFALVANYKSGSIAMLPIARGGRLGLPSHVIRHTGSGADPERQDGPHPHCIVPDPSNRFALAADLGADKLFIYHMDLEEGQLHNHTEIEVEAGAGPRHLIFSSSGQHAYLLNELNSTIIVYRYDDTIGVLDQIQTISTLPEDFSGENFCADLRMSPGERYLYACNRRQDSLVTFKVKAESGELTYQSHIPSHGREPRIFAIDPSGRFIVAAHQKSRNAVVYQIDPETGDLSHTGYQVELDMPVHVLFV